MYVYMHLYMYIQYVYPWLCSCVYLYLHSYKKGEYMYTHMCINIYTYMRRTAYIYICMYIYICIFITYIDVYVVIHRHDDDLLSLKPPNGNPSSRYQW